MSKKLNSKYCGTIIPMIKVLTIQHASKAVFKITFFSASVKPPKLVPKPSTFLSANDSASASVSSHTVTALLSSKSRSSIVGGSAMILSCKKQWQDQDEDNDDNNYYSANDDDNDNNDNDGHENENEDGVVDEDEDEDEDED